MTPRPGLLLASLLCLAGLASASWSRVQEGDDWDVTSAPDRDLVVATVQYASGAGIGIQCQGGKLKVVVVGMPTSTDEFRVFNATLANGDTRRTYWTGNAGPMTTGSARLARFLKQGGKLTLTSLPDAPHPARAEFDLPAQTSGIDQVLSACGYPLSDPRDDLPQSDDLLSARPRLEMPPSAMNRHPIFEVELSCIIASGRLSQCQSDHQIPRDPVGGERTARAANGAATRLTDLAAAEGRVIDLIIVGQRIRR